MPEDQRCPHNVVIYQYSFGKHRTIRNKCEFCEAKYKVNIENAHKLQLEQEKLRLEIELLKLQLSKAAKP